MTVVAGQQQVGAGCRLSGVAEGLDLGVRLGDATQGRACCREPRVAVDASLAVGGSDSLSVRPCPDVLANDAAPLPY